MKYFKTLNLLTLVLGLILPKICISQYYAPDYVYIDPQTNLFKLNGNDFYAKTINYTISIARDGNGNKFIAPAVEYDANEFPCNDPTSCLNKIKSDLTTIKNAGFNSIRLVGIAFGDCSDHPYYGTPCYTTYGLGSIGRFQPLIQEIESDYSDILGYYSSFLNAVQAVNNSTSGTPLKIQLLIGGKGIHEIYIEEFRDFLVEFGKTYKNNTELYSVDFYNEPSFNSESNHFNEGFSKEFVCEVTEKWNNAFKGESPHHLTTIGLHSIGNVIKWDPGFMNVDFLSYHPYPKRGTNNTLNLTNELAQIKKTFYWMGQTSKIPWIIGETGWTGIDLSPTDSIEYKNTNYGCPNGPSTMGSESAQELYIKNTFEFARDYGAAGYALWQYKDVNWGCYPNTIGKWHWGLYKYVTDPSSNTKTVQPKKIISSNYFNTVTTSAQSSNNVVPVGYYDFKSQNGSYYVEGTVSNQNGQPIEHAFVRAWCEKTNNNQIDWGCESQAITDANGYFKVNFPNYPSRLVVTGYGMSKYDNVDINPNLNNQANLNITLIEYIPDPIPRDQNNQIIYDLTLSGTISGSQSIAQKAANNIYASYDIFGQNQSNVVDLNAGNKIILKDGFKAGSGSEFSAKILNFSEIPVCGDGENYFRIAEKNQTNEVDSSSSLKVSIYPNPANKSIFIQTNTTDRFQLSIWNMDGRLVREGLSNKEIDISNLANGIYFLTIQVGADLVKKKLIKY